MLEMSENDHVTPCAVLTSRLVLSAAVAEADERADDAAAAVWQPLLQIVTSTSCTPA